MPNPWISVVGTSKHLLATSNREKPLPIITLVLVDSYAVRMIFFRGFHDFFPLTILTNVLSNDLRNSIAFEEPTAYRSDA